MKVQELLPQGYCKGVILSLKKCFLALEDETNPRPIYLLGKIIHNKLVCEALESLGIIVLDNDSRYNLLDKITSGTVIFSAHGVSKKVYDKALKKGLKIIDATCPFVSKVHKDCLNKLNNEAFDQVLYVGSFKHPEAMEVLNEDKRIVLVNKDTDFTSFNPHLNYYLTNQTTLSLDDLNKVYEKASILPHLEIENNICLSTTKRQNALKGLNTDLIVVIGDKLSSNTKKLYEVALKYSKFKKLLLIETIDDLLGVDLTSYKEAIVTSGASTPIAIRKEVINYLLNYRKIEAKSKLTNLDYLKIE